MVVGGSRQETLDLDVKTRIGKARAAHLQLKNIWNSIEVSTNNRIRTFNTSIKTILLYEAETWRTTKAGVYEQLQNTSDPLARHYQQQPTVEEKKLDSDGGRNVGEALKVNRTQTEEHTHLRHKPGLHSESSSPKVKRKTKEYTTL
ncbi:unnamed protein product [Schistosoma margrebowiei]|uniref:Uncharacterized protein n=1 Tax=Schistosoma margrebowiei TaxID=48269 RepID=A0A183NAY1_9TREM|nr:unnamed protein product [Schistosoma margrebowiei]